MYRRGLISSTCALAFLNFAAAADLPSRKQPPIVPPPPEFTWTGLYVGAQVGYAWARDPGANLSWPRVFTPTDFDSSGVIGGIHVGYNYQWKQFVLGVEGDAEGTSLNSTHQQPSLVTIRSASSIQGSIRGRLGVAFDRFLIYGTGGSQWGGIQNSYYFGLQGDSYTTTRSGWTVGGGLEYAFNNNWSARAEYRYADLGSYYDGNGPIIFPLLYQSHHWTENQVKVGFSWKFSAAARN